MKKIASILMIVFALSSCSDEIKKAAKIQALKDGEMWRATDAWAERTANGHITIKGLTQYETLTLKINSSTETTYVLGASTQRFASYLYSRDGEEILYATANGVGDGQIVLREYDADNQTVTGTFRFNAENIEDNPLGADVVNYTEGNFYKLPIIPVQ